MRDIILNNGVVMPQVGFGTFLIPKDVLPQTWDERHLLENISLFDFELTNEDMELIDSLDKGKCLNYNPYRNALTLYLPEKYKGWTGFEI